jgi:4-methyl-5(b-hydroxyethyl)-thiazole monophosphate biosynthesis
MKILLFVPQGFEVLEFSALYDVLSWAEDLDLETKVVTCGLKKQVIGAFGLILTVDMIIDDINLEDYYALAIPGGFEEYGYYEDVYNSNFLNIINEFHNKGKIIATICVGSLPLGKSGILAGKKATSYSQKDGYRQKELASFDVKVFNEPIVVDGNIITSNCPGTSVDVAFKLLEMLTDKDKMETVKTAMGF